MTELAPWIVAHALTVALVLARTAGLAWTGPALATPGLGVRFRILLALALAGIVAPMVVAEAGDVAALGGWSTFGRGMLVEALVGAALGWTAALVIAGARQAGDLVGAQAGFSSAALLDPEATDEVTAVGQLYSLLALALFLALDGPLSLVRALVASYQLVPAGGPEGALPSDAVAFVFGRVTDALGLVLQTAAPAALALAFTGLALALLGKAAPSFQRAALMLPVRSSLGLFLIFLGLGTAAVVFLNAWDGWPGPVFEAWTAAHPGG